MQWDLSIAKLCFGKTQESIEESLIDMCKSCLHTALLLLVLVLGCTTLSTTTSTIPHIIQTLSIFVPPACIVSLYQSADNLGVRSSVS